MEFIFNQRFNLPLITERDTVKSKYDHDRVERLEPPESYTPAPLVPGISSGHFPVPTLSSTITVIAPTHHGNSTTESWSEFHEEHTLDHSSFGQGAPQRKRCRDYDGKVFEKQYACYIFGFYYVLFFTFNMTYSNVQNSLTVKENINTVFILVKNLVRKCEFKNLFKKKKKKKVQ